MRLAASTQRLKSSRTRRRTSDLDLPLAWSIKLEPFSPLALSEADTVHRVRPDAREIKGDLPIPGKSGKGRSLDWQTEWIESVWPCLAAVLARCDDYGGYGARVVRPMKSTQSGQSPQQWGLQLAARCQSIARPGRSLRDCKHSSATCRRSDQRFHHISASREIEQRTYKSRSPSNAACRIAAK